MLTPAVCSKCGTAVLLDLDGPPKKILWFRCPICLIRVPAKRIDKPPRPQPQLELAL